MAVLGFLVQATEQDCQGMERTLAALPELTTYGVHQGSYVVAVAEAASHELEALLARVHALPGVLATYVTSLTIEDELPETVTVENSFPGQR